MDVAYNLLQNCKGIYLLGTLDKRGRVHTEKEESIGLTLRREIKKKTHAESPHVQVSFLITNVGLFSLRNSLKKNSY